MRRERGDKRRKGREKGESGGGMMTTVYCFIV